jgi:hypothetical protein
LLVERRKHRFAARLDRSLGAERAALAIPGFAAPEAASRQDNTAYHPAGLRLLEQCVDFPLGSQDGDHYAARATSAFANRSGDLDLVQELKAAP